jgi:hypothetical protein
MDKQQRRKFSPEVRERSPRPADPPRHHVHILEMNGDSYQLKQSKRRYRSTPADTPPAETLQA